MSMVTEALNLGGQLADTTAPEFDGDVLSWLEERGARFVKVAAWNATHTPSPGKAALGKDWPNKPYTRSEVIAHIKAGGNVGLLCGSHSAGLCLLDVDGEYSKFCEEFPGLAKAPAIIRPGADRAKILIRICDEIPKNQKWKFNPARHLEWLADGNQGVMPPSIHPTGAPYRLINADGEILEYEGWRIKTIAELWTGQSEKTAPAQGRETVSDGHGKPRRATLEFIAAGAPAHTRNNELYNAACDLAGCNYSQGEAESMLFPVWQRMGKDEDEFRSTVASAYSKEREPARPDAFKSLPIGEYRVTQGETPLPDDLPGQATGQNETIDLDECLQRNERGDAELLAHFFGNKARYDHSESAWYLWRGSRWTKDNKREIAGMMNQVAAAYLRKASDETAKGNNEKAGDFIKRARELQNLRRTTNVLTFATSIQALALDGSEWGTPAMLLPVANGTIDLSTGQLHEAHPLDYVRVVCPVEWRGVDEPCPLWEKTLQEIFDGDTGLIAFIQRLLGYAITGETKEQILPIFWGDGANGKSTIMDTLSAVLGDDVCSDTQADSLMDVRQNDGNGARPFVVSLRHKRLVWASESKEGQKLNAGLVKQLTGDGYITARPLYGKPITFAQTYKIFLVTNHCPRIPDDSDYAMWRRVLRIPFNIRFVSNPKQLNERKQDKDLLSKLRGEYSGILAWLVRGCLAWQKQGLGVPASVTESTEKYREDEDLTSQFCDECLLVGERHEVTAGNLYRAYVAWSSENGNHPVSSKAFGQRMTRRYGEAIPQKVGNKTQRVYKGIGLLTP